MHVAFNPLDARRGSGEGYKYFCLFFLPPFFFLEIKGGFIYRAKLRHMGSHRFPLGTCVIRRLRVDAWVVIVLVCKERTWQLCPSSHTASKRRGFREISTSPSESDFAGCFAMYLFSCPCTAWQNNMYVHAVRLPPPEKANALAHECQPEKACTGAPRVL